MAASLALGIGILAIVPAHGVGAVALCLILSLIVCLCLTRLDADRDFLVNLFIAGLLLRMTVGTAIFIFNLQEFFGGDAFTYDILGSSILRVWQGDMNYQTFQYMMGVFLSRNWGMIYIVGGIYSVTGVNMLAVQAFSAVLGAATAPVIYLSAMEIFQNRRVARIAGIATACLPSLVLWSSQGLKDGPLVFMLALSMLATLKLSQKFDFKYLLLLTVSLLGIFSLRFYVFYMMVAAIASTFLVGIGPVSTKGMVRQVLIVLVIAGAMVQLGVLRSASTQFEAYGNLEAIQRSRLDMAQSGASGFGRDVDVSTASGALSTIPLGLIYLLFAPFPWQLASLRQSITLPEMIVWWGSFPLLVAGLWYTLRFRMRRALPVLIFTTMLTLAYSVFQGNVGTAYRQRSQLLIFYFMFVSAGYVLMRERREDKRRTAQKMKERASAGIRLPLPSVGTQRSSEVEAGRVLNGGRAAELSVDARRSGGM